jgi:ABC-type glycerol-3-phosphate transport system substrate-binding protein
MRSGQRIGTLVAALALVAAAGCSGGGDDEGGGEDGARSIKVWTIEDVADRVAAQKKMAYDFTA